MEQVSQDRELKGLLKDHHKMNKGPRVRVDDLLVRTPPERHSCKS